MKNSNGVEIANGANGANAVELANANGANVGTISILPGHTLTFAAGLNDNQLKLVG